MKPVTWRTNGAKPIGKCPTPTRQSSLRASSVRRFLQLGVVFAVLLAFVFSEAWGEYNEAAQAVDLEVSAMHGVAMISATLGPAQANTILTVERAYLEGVAYQEWPVMARNRTADVETSHKLQVLIQNAANLRLTDPDQQDKKAEILSLLALRLSPCIKSRRAIRTAPA